MSETGSSEQEVSGMGTRIVVVDGADGLTPDMLRHKSPPKPKVYHKWQDIPRKSGLRGGAEVLE